MTFSSGAPSYRQVLADPLPQRRTCSSPTVVDSSVVARPEGLDRTSPAEVLSPVVAESEAPVDTSPQPSVRAPPVLPERVTMVITPMSPRTKVPSKSMDQESDQAASDDDSQAEVTIRTEEGREYTVFASGDGFAIVPEEVIAARLYGPDWLGSMTIRKENGRGDETGLWMDDRLVWELKPGSYVAFGVENKRGGKRSLSSSDGPSKRRGSVSQSERSSVKSAGGSVSRGYSLGVRGVAQSHQTARVEERQGILGGVAQQRTLSNRRDSRAGPLRGLPEEEEGETQSFLRTPLASEREGNKGASKGSESVEEKRVKVRDCGIARSILKRGLRKNSSLRRIIEEYETGDEDIEVVANVKYPLDGDVIVLKDKMLSMNEKAEDKGSNWNSGKTQNLKLENGETIRKYTCGGGFKCTNDNCWYVKENKQKNERVFRRMENENRVCKFCLKLAESVGTKCTAEKFVVNGESQVLVVHIGHHSHELEEQIDRRLEEEMKVRALLAGSESKQVRNAFVFEHDWVRLTINSITVYSSCSRPIIRFLLQNWCFHQVLIYNIIVGVTQSAVTFRENEVEKVMNEAVKTGKGLLE